MYRFVLGVVVGVIAATWLQRTQPQMVDQRIGEMQDRANQILVESRRVLEEVRREISAAVDTGRRSVGDTAERVRRGINPTTGEEEPKE